MEDEAEAGDLSSVESDVPPFLSCLDVDRQGKKHIFVNINRGPDEEEIAKEESLFPIPTEEYFLDDWGDVPVADDAAAPHSEEEEEEEPSDEPAPPPQPEPTPEPPPEVPAKSKKFRVQVDPNASIEDTSPYKNTLSTLPQVPESQIPYRPILYTFRVKARGKKTKLKHMKTKPPPLYLQFDHTIAVIWTLFSSDSNKDNLGIVQLQWALHFLQSIYNDEGIHPKDVQMCIDTIQDYLINKYSEMSGESAAYAATRFGDYVEDDRKKEPPFSVNYAQMINKCPPSVLESKESVMLDKQLLDELENVKKVVGIESIDLTKVVSKDQVVSILNDWKKEQIEKIQDELKMLYVVEDMLKNSDSQNFEGYTDEKQFRTIFKKK